MGSPVHPYRHVPLGRAGGPGWLQVVELAAPVALGQRAVISGPPRSGLTTVLREVTRSLQAAEPAVDVTVLLVDRPIEEHLEWRAEVPGATVRATSPDDAPAAHRALVDAARDARERCDAGEHAAIVIDSLGALARAVNLAVAPDDERVLDGGLAHAALAELRRVFGLGRALEAAGSLTVLATCTTGGHTHLDEVVLHELVGTGNMELRLGAAPLAAGLFPPIDLEVSGARHAEVFLGEAEADRRAALLSRLLERGTVAGLALLEEGLADHGSLEVLLALVAE